MKYIVFLTRSLQSQINGINRIYIGIHYTNPSVFDGYLGDGIYINKASTYMFPKTPLQYAVKKYGCKEFERITLYVCDTIEEASTKESQIVDKDFINQSYTYNTQTSDIRPIYQFDLEGNLVNSWKTTLEVSDFYSYSMKKFDFAASTGIQFLGFYWSREPRVVPKEGRLKFTYIYNQDGKLMKESIEDSPEGSNKMVDIFIPKPRKNLRKATIYVYKDNKLLGKYVGKEVFPVIGTFSFTKLNNAINGWYNDYYISLTEIDQVPARQPKKIEVYTKDGHFIESIESIKDVKEKYNIKSATLAKILKGVKQHEQYIFVYSK